MDERIDHRADFGLVRYANCWEDADSLVAGLAPGPHSRCLSIASAGDNSLALLSRTPAHVLAVDISAAQLACLELRTATIAALDYESTLRFLGFRQAPAEGSGSRTATYALLRERLAPDSRAFWDAHPGRIASGVIYHGKFERYFALFRRWALPLVHSRRTVAELLRGKVREERETFYRTRWNTWRWRLMFHIFFSRRVMGAAGRDPEFFRYVEGGVAQRILRRVTHALTGLPTHTNPYLRFILTGGFGQTLPLYIRREHFETIKANLDRLETFRGTVSEALRQMPGRFDVFNLSDIFEYMDHEEFCRTAGELLDAAAPGGRLAYWNMLVPRSVAHHFPRRATRLDELSDNLLAADKAFFYQQFHVDEVRDEGKDAEQANTPTGRTGT